MASSLDRISAEIPVSEWRAAPYQPGVTRRRSGISEASDHRPRTRVARTSSNEHVAENVISRRCGVPVPVVVPPAARNSTSPGIQKPTPGPHRQVQANN